MEINNVKPETNINTIQNGLNLKGSNRENSLSNKNIHYLITNFFFDFLVTIRIL